VAIFAMSKNERLSTSVEQRLRQIRSWKL